MNRQTGLWIGLCISLTGHDLWSFISKGGHLDE